MYSKAIIEKMKLESSVSFSSYHNLPDNKVLHLSLDDAKTTFTLKIFAQDDLTTSLKTKTLYAGIVNDGHSDIIFFSSRRCKYTLVCILANGTILLHREELGPSMRGDCLLGICSKTLEILDEDEWPIKPIGACALGKNHFFVINHVKDTPLGSGLLLTIYQQRRRWCLKTHEKMLFNCSYEYIEKIVPLGNNTFAFQCREKDGVLLLEVNPETEMIIEVGVIHPKTDRYHSSLIVEALPNRQLLTYQHTDDGAVQIWDVDTLRCIKEWNWKTIHEFAGIDLLRFNIYPLPDSKHLLVQTCDSLYVLNTDSLNIKEVALYNSNTHISYPKEKEWTGGVHTFDWFAWGTIPPRRASILILPDGKVWAYVNTAGKDDDCNRLLFDLEVIAHDRKTKKDFADSCIQTIAFFYSQELPKELVWLVFMDVLNPKIQADFIKKEMDVFNPEIQADFIEKEEDDIELGPLCILI